jgi:UrcA family protein
MKTASMFITAAFALSAVPAAASSNVSGKIEDVRVVLSPAKLNTAIPAVQRLEKFKRLAARKCDSGDRSLEAQKFERACQRELKRSILVQTADDALKTEARRQGILD